MKSNSGKRLICILWCLGLFLLRPPLAAAFSDILVNVEVIKATRNSTEIDPQLQDLVKELAPVLNYSGFSLLKKIEIRLVQKGKGDVILSSGRVLELEFLGFEDKQARLLVRIVEKGEQTFRTTLLMVDKGSVLIGGPPHHDGVLLLRIGAGFVP
ncbi:MAG: hypothetical protein L6406_13475 [Desulfobacterales bacterium]|nr:hypothetical protein [Pseudomonadota bacterium]MCG2776679.1 hypothetical protein [Desulfobacterales bacterium]